VDPWHKPKMKPGFSGSGVGDQIGDHILGAHMMPGTLPFSGRSYVRPDFGADHPVKALNPNKAILPLPLPPYFGVHLFPEPVGKQVDTHYKKNQRNAGKNDHPPHSRINVVFADRNHHSERRFGQGYSDA